MATSACSVFILTGLSKPELAVARVSSGRRPCCQWNLRSDAAMGWSLMSLAPLHEPEESNSQFSLPCERHHWPAVSCHS